jgi:hypothetical protein
MRKTKKATLELPLTQRQLRSLRSGDAQVRELLRVMQGGWTRLVILMPFQRSDRRIAR